MTRKEAREQAFILLFQNSFRNESLEELLETERENEVIIDDEFTLAVVTKTIENKAIIEETIKNYSKGWKIERISRVALAVLKLAVCEMQYFPDIPDAVSINEAVELAKKYATQEDASFINGILGSLARQ